MKTMRRPGRRTVIIAAVGLLVGLVALAAVVGVVRSGDLGGDGAADGGGAMPSASEGLALQDAETTKSLEGTQTGSDAERTAEAAGDESGGTTVSVPPVTLPGQNLVRTGQLALVVGRDTLESTVARIITITRGYEGYVVSSAVGGSGGPETVQSGESEYSPDVAIEPEPPRGDGEPYAHLIVRVPAQRFDEAIVRFQKLGKVVELTTSADDVSGQLVDLRARLRHYRAVEQRLLTFLDKADTVEAALAVQDRIDQTQMMVEELEAQLKRIDETVAYSTLSISLTEKERPTVVVAETGGGFGATITESLRLLGAGFRAIGIALTAALPFLAVIGVVGGGVYWVARRVRRRRDARSGPSGPGLPPAGSGRPTAAEGGPTG